MRLIDADKLRHELIMGHDLVGAKYVDMADTVKAIPIEWIKAKINNTPKFSEQGMYWLELLADWEKENEIDRRR